MASYRLRSSCRRPLRLHRVSESNGVLAARGRLGWVSADLIPEFVVPDNGDREARSFVVQQKDGPV